MATIYPVILAGGSGTRLWPLSRKNYPKQFLRLNGELSLLQHTLLRTQMLHPSQTIIVSNDAHYFLCQEQLQNYNLPITYLLEPCVRNTAPAIACAAHHLKAIAGDEAIMLVLPSDHWISDETIWKEALLAGSEFTAQNNAIMTFGIKPESPKTGYGYIEVGAELKNNVYQVASFKEKPEKEMAQSFIGKGNYFWNSGIFLCQVSVYLQELKLYEPETYEFSKNSLIKAKQQHDFIRMDLDTFSQCQENSIDYAIMEKTDKAVVLPVAIQWSDLGSWVEVSDSNERDTQGNALSGKVLTQDSYNCLINSEDILVTALGISDQIIVATKDAILIADKSYSHQVKELVHSLSKAYPNVIHEHQRVFRPWGYFEVVAEGPSFKVKRLMVKPGAKLSLQMHEHRAEHWVVVEGEAEIVNNDQTLTLLSNQSTYIPPQTLHRLSNISTNLLYVIEVQSGSYLGEDDIKRFDDIYSRA